MVRVTHPLHPRLRDRSLCRPLCGFGGARQPARLIGPGQSASDVAHRGPAREGPGGRASQASGKARGQTARCAAEGPELCPGNLGRVTEQWPRYAQSSFRKGASWVTAPSGTRKAAGYPPRPATQTQHCAREGEEGDGGGMGKRAGGRAGP